jgi:hypothetical protein
MKTYQIELRRTSFLNLTIDAENQEEAERLAWLQIELEPGSYGLWSIDSIEIDESDGQ